MISNFRTPGWKSHLLYQGAILYHPVKRKIDVPVVMSIEETAKVIALVAGTPQLAMKQLKLRLIFSQHKTIWEIRIN